MITSLISIFLKDRSEPRWQGSGSAVKRQACHCIMGWRGRPIFCWSLQSIVLLLHYLLNPPMYQSGTKTRNFWKLISSEQWWNTNHYQHDGHFSKAFNSKCLFWWRIRREYMPCWIFLGFWSPFGDINTETNSKTVLTVRQNLLLRQNHPQQQYCLLAGKVLKWWPARENTHLCYAKSQL